MENQELSKELSKEQIALQLTLKWIEWHHGASEGFINDAIKTAEFYNEIYNRIEPSPFEIKICEDLAKKQQS